jgi:uncharacterized protein YyaL (SSP411 family)
MTEDIFALPQAWRMAIQREQDAHDFYVRMAKTATDASAKALFEELAAEETKHKQRLEAEYRRVFERDLEEPRRRVGIFEHDLRDKRPAGIAWWDWEEETFRLAEELDVPILLSISAVWCRWCHVMDETSYANPEVTALINADFIPIRVDTDQRPDINSRYNMGGWPTIAFLTPDGEVLTGVTYVPPEEFKKLLSQVSDYYRNNKDAVQAKLSELEARRRAAEEARARVEGELSISIVEEVAEAVVDGFDPLHGGFGEAPKFPQAEALELALAEYRRTKDERLLEVVTKTLSVMAQGGIYDQEMGGFFRYSTTRDWSIPHFEKMLEDNARLLSLYLHAYQVMGEELYRETALGIVGYVEADIRDRERGYFYGSQDADEEYYKLSKAEREKREAPFTDKIAYTDRNAMMVSAYLEAALVLDQPWHAESALKALGFLWRNCRQEGQGMYHYYDWKGEGLEEGKPHVAGLLADQVWMAKALLDAYEYTGEGNYLLQAEELMKEVYIYWSDDKGGFFDRVDVPDALGKLQERFKNLEENALAAEVAIRLYYLTGDEEHQRRAASALEAFAAEYRGYHYFGARYALAVSRFLNPPLSVVVVGSAEEPLTGELRRASLEAYVPHRMVHTVDPVWEPERLARLGYPPEPSPATYICFGEVCAAPAKAPSQVKAAIESLAGR